MPKANDDRKPVGTAHCNDCGLTAAFYQVTKGKRRGYLYKRCPPPSAGGCGCDQSAGAVKQQRWLTEMQRTDEPMIEHPLNLAEPENVEVDETPENGADENLQTPEKSRGLLGIAGMAVVGLAAYFLS